MDVCKIAPGIYQYTAIDDCTRYKVLRLFRRRTANNTMEFFDAVIRLAILSVTPDLDWGKLLACAVDMA